MQINFVSFAACKIRICKFIKAVKVLLPFVTTYLGEAVFSAVAVMKTRYRPRLKIEKVL
jgi:hypothetical protein